MGLVFMKDLIIFGPLCILAHNLFPFELLSSINIETKFSVKGASAHDVTSAHVSLDPIS